MSSLIKYPFLSGIVKGAISLVAFGVPILLTTHPAVASLTLGTVVTVGVEWLEKKFGIQPALAAARAAAPKTTVSTQ